MTIFSTEALHHTICPDSIWQGDQILWSVICIRSLDDSLFVRKSRQSPSLDVRMETDRDHAGTILDVDDDQQLGINHSRCESS
jgi:hypothetical protein